MIRRSAENCQTIPVIDENISDDPALEEGGVGDKTVIGGGFVTDASGMICGISDLSVISEDGYLILPSEGCRGIAGRSIRFL